MNLTRYAFLLTIFLFMNSESEAQYSKGQKLVLIHDEWVQELNWNKPPDVCSVYIQTDSAVLLSQWMKMNRHIQIEIAVYSEAQSSPAISIKNTSRLAECIKSNLISSGIDEQRILTTGKGEHDAKITDSLLRKKTDPAERKKMSRSNNKIEITITSTSYKSFFTYSDREFFPGQAFDPLLTGQLSRNLEFLFIENSKRDPFAHPDDIVYTIEDRKKDSAFKVLNLLSVMLVSNPTVKVDIAIHSSTEGSAEKNLSLTRSQSEEIKKYLLSRGVHPAQLSFTAMGEKKPLVTEQEISKLKPDLQRTVHKKNQRVEITIADL